MIIEINMYIFASVDIYIHNSIYIYIYIYILLIWAKEAIQGVGVSNMSAQY